MASSYLSHCRICDTEFVGKENWTRHLFQEDHQTRARLEWGKWEEAKRECALVAFFSCPVTVKVEGEDGGASEGGASNLVVLLWKYLKRIADGNDGCEEEESLLIADYVWWRERASMAIILFESREIADYLQTEIMKIGGAPRGEPIKIGNHFVQFKKLVDLTASEWNNQAPDINLQSSSSGGPPYLQNRKRPASSSPLSSCSSDDLASPAPSTGNDNIPTSTSALVNQFNTLLKSVEISSSEYQQAIKITEQVQALLSSEYPSCQVFLFRHNFLKIFNPFCNDLLIFAHGGPSKTTDPGGLQKIAINQVAKLAVIQDPTLFYLIYGDEPKYKDSQLFQLANSPTESPFNFWITTDHAYLLEVQLNRLLTYIVSFHPKCGLLLSVLHYFSTQNSCYFGGDDNSTSKTETMEWLLVYFLAKEKKMVPSVRQVQELPHQPIYLPNYTRNIDIGFNPDPDFVKKWKANRAAHEMENLTEEYVIDVLRLFQGFLRFVSKILAGGNFILNIRDAELHNVKQVLFHPRSKWHTKWTDEEIEIVRSNPRNHGSPQSNKWPFKIVHPFLLHSNLGYNIEEFDFASKVMKRGVFHLNRFLNLNEKEKYVERWVQKKGDLPEIYNTLESALKIEDVPEVQPKKEKNQGNKKWRGGKN